MRYEDNPPFPKNQFEFHRMFDCEGKCVEHMKAVVYPDGFVCDKCEGEDGYWIEDRRAFECADCGHWNYLTEGTVMQKSSTPLCKWFLGAYLQTTMTPGISAMMFQRQAGLTRYETAFQMLHKLRAAMVNPEREPLSGEVEVDETFIGGERAGKRGRGAEGKSIVVGAVEVVDGKKGPIAGRVRFQTILDASGESLLEFIDANIEEGSTVVTDGWSGYSRVSKHGYNHEVVEGEDSKEVAEQLEFVHRMFSLLKRWLLGTHHGVSPQHLQAYLNEFTFRFNRRANPWLAFDTLLGMAGESEAPTYDELYAVGDEDGWIHPGATQLLV